jgi:hypothetical protein
MPRRSSRERRSSPSTRLASDRSSSEMAEGPSAGTARVVSCSRGLEFHSLGDAARHLRATLVPLQRRSSTVHAHEERHSLGNEGRTRETARPEGLVPSHRVSSAAQSYKSITHSERQTLVGHVQDGLKPSTRVSSAVPDTRQCNSLGSRTKGERERGLLAPPIYSYVLH